MKAFVHSGKFKTVLLAKATWNETMVCPQKDLFDVLGEFGDVTFVEDKKGTLFLHRNFLKSNPLEGSYRLSTKKLHPVKIGDNVEWVGEPQVVFSALAWERSTEIIIEPEEDPSSVLRLELEERRRS